MNPKEKVDEIVTFLKKTFKTSGFTDAVVAVSGGVDSAVSRALAVKALGKDHVHSLFLPYGILQKKETIDANQTIDITKMVDEIALYDNLNSIRKGNIMARVRMILVFDQAKKRNALVVGTENKTEHILGYYTRFGDEASDVEPLRSLYKTQVYQIAKELHISELILSKAPSAGLWEGQTDEEEFGFTYKDADTILSLYVDEKKTVQEIITMGLKKETVDKVLGLAKKNQFKQNLPYNL